MARGSLINFTLIKTKSIQPNIEGPTPNKGRGFVCPNSFPTVDELS